MKISELEKMTEKVKRGEVVEGLEAMIAETVAVLNSAGQSYEAGSPIMSNYDYDKMYDCLQELEKAVETHSPNSPTQTVGSLGDPESKLKPHRHEYPALSLNKTKDVAGMCRDFDNGIRDGWAKGHNLSPNVVIMWKLDGSTVVLTYRHGVLVNASTRGNGEVGYDITHNAPFIKGIPLSLNTDIDVVVRGEALMSYESFASLNSGCEEMDLYKNPRNLATATINMLEMDERRKGKVEFKAFSLSYSPTTLGTFSARMQLLESLGFDTVPWNSDDISTLTSRIQEWTDRAESYGYPVDGLVLALEEAAYAETLPGTGKYPNKMVGYALKWADETAETVLRDIEWSTSRTGLLNPVAVFDPVELEGTTVTRASLFNVSYILDRNLMVGDTITVYKANKIIPQVDKNLSYHKHMFLVAIHCKCPACGSDNDYKSLEGSVAAICPNPDCPAKNIGRLVHFAERDCMNIVGLSEEKLTYLVDHGYVRTMSDLMKLPNHRNESGVTSLDNTRLLEDEPGWGTTSVSNLVNAIESAKTTDFVSLLHSFGIPNVGKGQAKLLKKAVEKYHDDSHRGDDHIQCLKEMVKEGYDFTSIDGFGDVIAGSLTKWISDNLLPDNTEVREICALVSLSDRWPETQPSGTASAVAGKTYVITGSLEFFKNRDALIADIESKGGKVSGSVSAKTDYLINNDVTSTSGKNKKAHELNIPIISESDYLKM